MAKPKITLYVDVVSPFGYLAFYALRNFSVFAQCEITYVPIFLGGLMKQCDNRPPIAIKNKAEYIGAQRTYLSTLFSIPMLATTPPKFPANTITVQRILASVSLSHPALLAPAIEETYNAYWLRGEDITEAGVIKAALGKVRGLDVEGVVQAAGGAEVKGRLSEATGEAFEGGAFGLPWWVATNSKGETQSFWGFDQIGRICVHLGLERPREGAWKPVL